MRRQREEKQSRLPGFREGGATELTLSLIHRDAGAGISPGGQRSFAGKVLPEPCWSNMKREVTDENHTLPYRAH